MPTLELPSRDSNDSCISRIFQRSSALFRTRPVSVSSVHTTETALPQYTIFDPGSTTPSSFNQTSPTEDDESYGSSSIQLQGQHHGPVVLRYSGTSVGNSSELATRGSSVGRVAAEEYNIFSFPVKGTKPWVTLHLYSPRDKHVYERSSSRRPTRPQAYGGSNLKGMIEITADKPIAIRDIKFIIKGRVVMGPNAEEYHTFLNQATHVWSKSNGDPRSGGSAHSSRGEAFNGKFMGYYEIPFFCSIPTLSDTGTSSASARFWSAETLEGITPFPLTGHTRSTPPSPTTPRSPTSPSGLSLGSSLGSSDSQLQVESSHNSVTQFGTALPPSFFDTAIATTIQYEVYLQISHGLFRLDTRITTGITYVPTVTPPLMPQSRRAIYEAIPGRAHASDHHSVVIQSPLTDPAGWVKCPSATLNGVMANINKPIKVACDLYLARPLSYTRGTIIPCFLSLSSDDFQLLDILSTPTSPCVYLTRIIHHTTQAYQSWGSEEDTSVLNGTDLRASFSGFAVIDGCTHSALPKIMTHTSAARRIASAVWWKPTKDVEQRTTERYLGGEIHLVSDATIPPSSTCSFFRVEYFIEMLPFRTQSCTFEAGVKDVVISQLVEIASTLSVEGIIPIPFTRPPQCQTRYRSRSDVVGGVQRSESTLSFISQ